MTTADVIAFGICAAMIVLLALQSHTVRAQQVKLPKVACLKEKATLIEIPGVQRFAVRFPLDRLLPKVRSRSKRDRAITKAHVYHGYSQREIAAHVGLHYSTVSRIVQRGREKSRYKTCPLCVTPM